MFRTLKEDIETVLSRDPAAHSKWEVLLCYPGVKAIRSHRRAHRAYEKGHIIYARWISQRARRRTGIEIHPGATCEFSMLGLEKKRKKNIFFPFQ